MRLSYMLLVVLAIQLENTAAADQLKLSRPAENLNARHLRVGVKSADYYDGELENDGLAADNEERVAFTATLKKALQNEKIIDISEDTVKNMLKSKVLRRKEFRTWDEAGHGYNDVKKVVTDPKLLGYYLKHLGLGPQRRAKPRRAKPRRVHAN